jgi:molybdate transport system substrate-binding protein
MRVPANLTLSRVLGLLALIAAMGPTGTAASAEPAAGPAGSREPLFVYCGAGFRLPVEAIAREYETARGTAVDLTFAGSGCLIAQAELGERGDLFIPGEEHYMEKARERGLITTVAPVAYLRPVVAVRPGNPHRLHTLQDLATPGLRLGLGDPQSVAVGLAAERWIAGELPAATAAAISRNVITRAINVNELGNQLALGGLDAAIVWDVTLPLFPDLEAVTVESGAGYRTLIIAGSLAMSRQPEEAAAFLDFLTGPRGDAIFAAHGYEPAGDATSAASPHQPDGSHP